MTLRNRYERLVREIDLLPPQEQIEHLLEFFSELSAEMHPDAAAFLKDYFSRKGTPEGDMFAEVVEGQLALRKIQD